ncbi:MAG TPA: flagellar filament capping protein FliD [Rectinemataceae bacterium]|nr:flagellar filament capping protein FliD [Rectinemataceae bacterium]
MSDISIPGVGTDKYGSDKLIEGLMKLERVPRDREADRLKTLQDQRAVWLDFNQRLSTLRGSAQDLFSFKNPFADRLAKSSNEDSLTATATREALEQTRTIVVKQVASADRFISSELPKDYRVPAGTYSFTVGGKSLDLRFSGGSLQEFADALTRKGGDLIRAEVIAVQPTTLSLVVESLKTGAVNKLGFAADALPLALDTHIVERVSSSRQDFDPSKPAAWTTGIDSSLVKVAQAPAELGLNASAQILAIVAGSAPGEAKLALPTATKSGGLTLELKYRLVPLSAPSAAVPPPGPSLKSIGSATYEGITVNGAPSASALPDWSPPPLPPRIEDKAMASLLTADGRAVPLPELQDGTGIQTLSVRLSDYLPDISAIAFRVRDTTRRLEIVSARVYDPSETGGYRPLKPISTAQDAVASVDGIDIQRPSNDISDAVPGVTLTLKAPSDKPVRLTVEPNRDAAKDAIIAMVGNYNRLMAQINILSSKDDRLISEITYFTDDEKKSAAEHLGELQGDPTLSLLRSSLQRIMMNSYPTAEGSALALLAQIGIATDASKPGGGKSYDVSKMRGYLEIDEDALKKALQDHFVGVKQLFGYDSQGSLIVDSGVAFSLDRLLKPYVETGGIISLKTGTLDQQITSTKKTIDDLDVQLAAKQQDLKEKYGQMEGALNQMQSTSNSLDNFAKNGGQ